MTARDKKGKFVPSKCSNVINDFLEENCWSDIWRVLNPELFCFTYHRKIGAVYSRLNYFLIPQGMINQVAKCEIWPGYLTDHSFVYLQVKFGKNIRGKGYWKMNESHLKDKKFVNEMNETINTVLYATQHLDHMSVWEIIKNNAKVVLQEYAREKAKSRKEQSQLYEQKIRSLNKKLSMINLTATNAISIIECVNDKLDYWQNLKRKVELYKVQGQILRSKVRWVESGEKSTDISLA